MTFKIVETVLASAVADAGTVTLGYPAGTTQFSFTGGNASDDGKAIINGNEIYTEAAADIALAYGASNITLTNNSGQTWPAGASVTVELGQANGTVGVEQFTAAGTVTPGKTSVEISGTSIIAVTLADATEHLGLFVVKNTSASGTAAHTLTLTSGTFDGTNDIATLNAPNECLVVWFDSAGNGTIVENVGAVALSSS